MQPKNKLENIRIFGSVLRGEEREDSDIDILFDFTPDANLLDWVGFQQDLEEELGKKIDAVPAKSLHWYIKDKILNEAKTIT